MTFARYADTVCPLVLSHGVLTEFLKQTQIVTLRNEDGTAIGDAIALAAARLKKAEEEIQRRNASLGFAGRRRAGRHRGLHDQEQVMILLTDGQNNAGRHSPLEAAELAKKWGIKIYCIGIGSAQAYRTVQTPLGTFRMPAEQELDEGLLKSIADNDRRLLQPGRRRRVASQDRGEYRQAGEDGSQVRAVHAVRGALRLLDACRPWCCWAWKCWQAARFSEDPMNLGNDNALWLLFAVPLVLVAGVRLVLLAQGPDAADPGQQRDAPQDQ